MLAGEAPRWRAASTALVAFLSSAAVVTAQVDVGYDVFSAAQAMVNLASHSWEWGTGAEALLELYNPELSVFSSNPFPNGRVPQADPSIFPLQYAKSFIDLNGQVLVADSAVGDPASLGVSAVLIGQSDSEYLDAANREADYILNQAPRWSNGAISHRPDVAEIWADNMAMSFPFLAYLAVQTGNTSLMSTTVTQCGLQRAVLKTDEFDNWRHIIGPQSQDTGLWSTGNGWAAYGMVRVLHTLQKWSGSSSMTSEASQLKGWIQEILDGAMLSGFDDGLLRNYLNDASWFGEISGTALLTAAAYRMAVNDPSMFPKKYITWADTNRAAIARHQGSNGIFSPAVDPYDWTSRTEFTSGSPEGQAFAVYLYTAYRDCVEAGICSPSTPSATTISSPGVGPIDLLTILFEPVTFSAMPAPTNPTCGSHQSCDADGCNGAFNGLAISPVCKGGSAIGCTCIPTPNTCGDRQSCDLNGCAGQFNGLAEFAQCEGNFKGCNCTATSNTCGDRQSCDLNGCAGEFNGLAEFAQCEGNFKGCNCTITTNTCGAMQSCDLNGCAGKFPGTARFAQCSGNFKGCNCLSTANTCGQRQSCDLNGCDGQFFGSVEFAQCTNNFIGCNCTATSNTCGDRQSCDLHGCDGEFHGSTQFPQCSGNFVGCNCQATSNTCGSPQDCSLNSCQGTYSLNDGNAYCTDNFVGCQCKGNPNTCGSPQSCDMNNCKGAFPGNVPFAECTDFFKGCKCTATSTTCGKQQSCDLNGCAGGFDSKGVARCQGNFQGCPCIATSSTCGTAQNCDKNGCAGTFDSSSDTARCRGNFAGCVCLPVASTCGKAQSCTLNGCDGGFDNNGNAICFGNFQGCPCIPNPIWIPPPPRLPRSTPTPTPTPAPMPVAIVGFIQEVIFNADPREPATILHAALNINNQFNNELCNVGELWNDDGEGAFGFPRTAGPFNIDGYQNCVYSGTPQTIGSIKCDNGHSATSDCTTDGSVSTCDLIQSFILQLKCIIQPN